jgi:hypothetical protein
MVIPIVARKLIAISSGQARVATPVDDGEEG